MSCGSQERTSHNQAIERFNIVTIDAAEAIATLHSSLANGHFASTVERCSAALLEEPNADTDYCQELEKNGKAAAESLILESALLQFNPQIGDAVAPIVASVVRLIDSQSSGIKVNVFPFVKYSYFPFSYKSSPETFGIAISNPEMGGCGCTEPRNSDKFGMYGDLGITSFAIAIDPLNAENNRLVLMLPIRRERADVVCDGFTAVVIGCDGSMYARTCDFILWNGYAEGRAFGINEPLEPAICGGGSISKRVGFPGAEEYIASSLRQLAEYLSDVADKLDAQHLH